MQSQLVLDPNRLFAAADALLEAMQSPRGRNALVLMHVGDRPAGGNPAIHGFTRAELVEAMTMLLRMGYADSE